MKQLGIAALALAFVGLVGIAQAEDKKADPTGTWKWSFTVNGETRESTLKLKLEGDKLTGAAIGRDGKENPIEEGTFKDGEVSFKVTRERNGNKFTAKYTGKVTEDTIKGKIETERDGQARSRDWEAKREKA